MKEIAEIHLKVERKNGETKFKKHKTKGQQITLISAILTLFIEACIEANLDMKEVFEFAIDGMPEDLKKELKK